MARRRLYRLGEVERIYSPDNLWTGLNLGGGALKITGTDSHGVEYNVIQMNNPGAYVEDRISFNYPLAEVKFTRWIKESGSKLDLMVDDAVLHIVEGPAAWEFSPSIKVLPGTHDVQITALGGGEASLGELKVISYEEINCLFRRPVPFKQEMSPTSHNILRGFNVFQQTNRGHATSKFNLYFNETNAYLDFIANSYKVHAIKDELGIFYRGIIVVEDVTMIAENCFYVDCTFNAPYQAGVGW